MKMYAWWEKPTHSPLFARKEDGIPPKTEKSGDFGTNFPVDPAQTDDSASKFDIFS